MLSAGQKGDPSEHLRLQSRIDIPHYLDILSIGIMVLVSSEGMYIWDSLDMPVLNQK